MPPFFKQRGNQRASYEATPTGYQPITHYHLCPSKIVGRAPQPTGIKSQVTL
jgi:hypothetical protein